MARRPLIAGNWKMNLDRARGVELAERIARGAADWPQVDVAVCPPSVYLEAVGGALAGSPVGLGAQNMWYEASGAFTGEISGPMLCDLGCRYVILGHSERRMLLGEDDALVHRKVVAALGADLTPIVCLGEQRDERRAGRTLEVIRRQFEGSLAGLNEAQIAGVVVAYEPIWAIGTGEVATPEQAEEVHADLREMLANRYNRQIAETVCIQYGGSVKPDNAGDLLQKPNIDGALVGGASLAADSFLAIVAAASRL